MGVDECLMRPKSSLPCLSRVFTSQPIPCAVREVDPNIRMQRLPEVLPLLVCFLKNLRESLVENRIEPAIIGCLINHRAKGSVR